MSLLIFLYFSTVPQPFNLQYVYICMYECVCVVGPMFCAQLGSQSAQYNCNELSPVHQTTSIELFGGPGSLFPLGPRYCPK